MTTNTLTRYRASRRARHGADRGQALVEFALFFMILVLMIAGASDEALLLSDHENVVFAARQGARTAAVMGPTKDADCAAIGAVQSSLANAHDLTITKIIVYQAGANGLPTGASGEDIYPGNAQCTVVNGVATISPAGTTVNWPPTSRSNTIYYEDSVGVEIDFTYNFMFKLIGSGSYTGSDHAVMPIEPAGS